MRYRFTDAFPYLLNRVGVLMGEGFAEELAADGLTLQMYRVLAVLQERHQLSLGELAKLLRIEMSTLSRLVTTLKKRGMLERSRLETDGRTVSIILTEEGMSLLTTLLIPRAKYWEKKAIEGLSSSEIEALKMTLNRIYANLSND